MFCKKKKKKRKKSNALINSIAAPPHNQSKAKQSKGRVKQSKQILNPLVPVRSQPSLTSTIYFLSVCLLISPPPPPFKPIPSQFFFPSVFKGSKKRNFGGEGGGAGGGGGKRADDTMQTKKNRYLAIAELTSHPSTTTPPNIPIVCSFPKGMVL